MEPQLNVSCPVAPLDQVGFGEPMVRVNADRVDGDAFGWSEAAGWDAKAKFYNNKMTG
jgi:UDP-glucose 4-epimerase